tara:strand:+ start:598 stop:846 length:249 start_codon:yes stop_codon:yes gene_type:complete
MASIPYEYVLIAVGWVALFVGYGLRENIIKMFAAMFLITFGVLLIANGLDGTSNLTVDVFGVLHIGLGAYAFITSSGIFKEK